MNSHSQQRRVGNIGSILLTPQENECLFNYLGRKCNTLCSAVVQVYGADRSSSWMKRCCGVACLIKDNPLRSYFIRVFDIKEGKTMFEQELYNNFSINSSRSYFISFAGDNCQVGLNFASEEEAKRFRAALNELLGRRQRKTEKRCDPANGPALPMATVDIKNPEINNVRFHNSQQQLPQPHHINNMLHSSLSKKEKKVKCKRKKLTKADIGTPSNFQHIGHVGWDPNTGFDLNNLDPELKNLFDMCGISEAQLKDKETSKVIYDFIEKKGGVEAVKNELRRQAPPPPPSRGGPPPPTPPHSSGPAPPPPPLRGGRGAPHLHPLGPPPRPLPHPRPPGLREPPPATTTTSSTLTCQHSTPGPPPPPPPPPPGPPPPPELDCGVPLSRSPQGSGGKSALLEQIRGGTQLKKVEAPVSKPPATTVGRDALLDQIRQGIQLKTVPDGPDSGSPTPAPSAGIVGALMEVMQKRSKAIHSSDEDDDDDEEDFEDDDEWDD
uniref:Actin nucleation-promoting factor WASL n=1 Tax=Oncorhynchus tshawytscha TaxID=74940 RepID=A0A8C8JE72_ONCTS